jgi:hypothetical protein
MIEMYAARDEDGSLWLFPRIPIKKKGSSDYWGLGDGETGFFKINNQLLPNVKWTDEKPTLVTLKIVEDEESYKKSCKKEK